MNRSKPIADNADDSLSSGDSEVAFAFMDFSDVDFGDDSKQESQQVEERKTDEEEVMEEVKPINRISVEETEDNKAVALEGNMDIELPLNSTPTTLTTQQQYELQQQRPLRTVLVSRVHAYDNARHMDSQDKLAISIEHAILSNDCYIPSISNTDDDRKVVTLNGNDGDNNNEENNTVLISQMIDDEERSNENDGETIQRIRTTARRLAEGRYVDVLSGSTSHSLFPPPTNNSDEITTDDNTSVARHIRTLVMRYCTDIPKCIEVELFAVAALNLFLQVNYTGPSFHQKGLVRPGYEGSVGGADGNGEDAKGNGFAAVALELLERINPHVLFASQLKVSSSSSLSTAVSEMKNDSKDAVVIDVPFQNAVLAELAVDGEWPCPVCEYPYFLLLARSILLTLADPNRPDWSYSIKDSNATTITNENCNGSGSGDTIEYLEQNPNPSVKSSNDTTAMTSPTTINSSTTFVSPTRQFVGVCQNLMWCNLYSARAGVAHYRLLQVEDLPMTLWREVEAMFRTCILTHCRCDADNDEDAKKKKEESTESREKYLVAAKVMLEYGLAEHHFDMNKKGKESFQKALHFSGLTVEVTGAEGRRTKYQKKATAQMLVRAEPKTVNVEAALPMDQASKTQVETKEDKDKDKDTQQERVEKQMIQHDEETILLNKVKYVSSEDNVHYQLTILEQVILLALCLDVKNDNPMDGLTAEQMGAFLERVLQQHDDWMVYATALLERAWLESERNHTRERAILQIQALADQHTNRLTLTQSTFQAAVEDSAPPQERLRNLHSIVYPPRWVVLRDLAERYAKIGIVTTAAELFEEIERWDDVVECYQRAGKENKAEEVIRKRLKEAETPRMWAALGDIKNDPKYYERALKVSNGRFSGAYVALGKFHSDKGDLPKAAQYFKEAVRLKPLSTHVWFRLGAISMNLKDWEFALHAFSEVVQQEPEEADAWANVAAIHMHNKNPSEAYPALVESLKLNRNNWRVWASKLWTCMDLKKYDEAIQASIALMDLRTKRNASEKIPTPEERVIRAIVGGAISQYEQAVKGGDIPAVDSGKRTISRVRELLSKVKSCVKNEPWIFETCAFFNEKIGRTDQVVKELMKEYRALHNILGWETDTVALPRICMVINQLFDLHVEEAKVESMKKFKFLVNGAVRKVRAAYFDLNRLPKEINDLETILSSIETQVSRM